MAWKEWKPGLARRRFANAGPPPGLRVRGPRLRFTAWGCDAAWFFPWRTSRHAKRTSCFLSRKRHGNRGGNENQAALLSRLAIVTMQQNKPGERLARPRLGPNDIHGKVSAPAASLVFMFLGLWSDLPNRAASGARKPGNRFE
jgi:hypothetical protein